MEKIIETMQRLIAATKRLEILREETQEKTYHESDYGPGYSRVSVALSFSLLTDAWIFRLRNERSVWDGLSGVEARRVFLKQLIKQLEDCPEFDNAAAAAIEAAERFLSETEGETVRKAVDARLPAIEQMARETKTYPVEQLVRGIRSDVEGRPDRAIAELNRFELSSEMQALRAAWEKHLEDQKAIEAGELLIDFGGAFKNGSGNKQVDYWVIEPDGTCREPDKLSLDSPRYATEGSKKWHRVGSEELALVWRKLDTSTPHDFGIVKRPVRGCTHEQLAAVVRIEDAIQKRWWDERSMSGRRSPTIGRGWGLVNRPEPNPAVKPEVLAQPNREINEATVQQPVAPRPPAVKTVTFTDEGGRHFRCSCSAMERIGKGDWNAYQAGQALTITCGCCKGVGTVRK